MSCSGVGGSFTLSTELGHLENAGQFRPSPGVTAIGDLSDNLSSGFQELVAGCVGRPEKIANFGTDARALPIPGRSENKAWDGVPLSTRRRARPIREGELARHDQHARFLRAEPLRRAGSAWLVQSSSIRARRTERTAHSRLPARPDPSRRRPRSRGPAPAVACSCRRLPGMAPWRVSAPAPVAGSTSERGLRASTGVSPRTPYFAGPSSGPERFISRARRASAAEPAIVATGRATSGAPAGSRTSPRRRKRMTSGKAVSAPRVTAKASDQHAVTDRGDRVVARFRSKKSHPPGVEPAAFFQDGDLLAYRVCPA